MYFHGYSEDSGTAEHLPSGPDHLADPGGPLLPFDYLDPRVFEILVYRLLCAERPQANVILMQGTGERGRDILVYQDDQLKSIVQCKNYRDRLPPSQVRQELLKIAFHSILDSSVLQKLTTYELWCGGGLSEEAEVLVATWPTQWTETMVRPDAERVLRRYAAFSSLEWKDVCDYALNRFARELHVVRVDSVELSRRTRQAPQVYSAFFSGNVVMRETDVERVLEKLMARTSATSSLSDADARRIVDRILSFPQEERLVIFSTVLLGISPRLVARLDERELEEFSTHVLTVTGKLTEIIVKACQRLQFERVAEFRRHADRCHPSLPALLGQMLIFGMIARLTGVQMGPIAPKPWVEYRSMSLDQRIDAHIEWQYEDYQACLSKYLPSRDKPGSDLMRSSSTGSRG